MKRESGILLSISSLPSRYGIGCFSKEAYEFVDQLKQAGQSCWQILPLGPTSYGDSPYQSFSTFAGNPYFISLEDLIEEGVLTRKECDSADFGTHPGAVDYAKIYKERFPLLRLAYERSNISQDEEFKQFSADNKWWLEDYALFMAVKSRFDGKPWTQWAEDIRLRWQNALDYYRRELYYDIEFHEYLQFKFIRQWNKLKSYANHNGIRIVGDIPIYVAMDSADAWAHPELFELDRDNVPTAVAGCPPDGFSSTGQLWGNPLYRWDYHRQTGYQWWISRLSYCYRLYDCGCGQVPVPLLCRRVRTCLQGRVFRLQHGYGAKRQDHRLPDRQGEGGTDPWGVLPGAVQPPHGGNHQRGDRGGSPASPFLPQCDKETV